MNVITLPLSGHSYYRFIDSVNYMCIIPLAGVFAIQQNPVKSTPTSNTPSSLFALLLHCVFSDPMTINYHRVESVDNYDKATPSIYIYINGKWHILLKHEHEHGCTSGIDFVGSSLSLVSYMFLRNIYIYDLRITTVGWAVCREAFLHSARTNQLCL